MGDIFGSQQSGTTTTTTKQEPWAEQKPYLLDVFNKAKQLYNSPGPSYYPGSTVAGFDPAQESGLSAMENRAMQGSPLNDAAHGQALATMRGDFLTPDANPFLKQYSSTLYDSLRPKFDAQFSNAGRYGSGAHQAALTDAVASAAMPFYAQNYQTERGRQMDTMNAAPQLAATDYQDISQLLAAGGQRQQQDQGVINADLARWNFNQQLPANKLAQLSQLVQGNYGGTSTQSQPYYTNPMSSALGAITGLGSMAGMLGWAPFSDRRLKENIAQIGTATNGLPLYRFNYKGDPRPQIGVMAQDVEQVIPEAVFEIDGFKAVDYERVFPIAGSA